MKNWYRNNKSRFIVLLILVALVLLISFASRSENIDTVSPNESPQSSEESTAPSTAPSTKKPSSTQTSVKTALKTHSDKKYGFTFEYPEGYSVTSLGSIVGPSGVTAVRFGAVFTTANGEIANDNVPSYLLDRRLADSKTELIGNYTWQKDAWFAGYSLGYSLRTGGVALGFAALKESDEILLRQIVRSVKFTKLGEPRLDEVFRALKVGDSFGSLKVYKILAGEQSKLVSPDNFTVEFTGQLVLRGFYDVEYLTGRSVVCLSRLDSGSLASLPKLDQSHDYTNTKICFNYDDFFAKSVVKAEEGNAGVVINNLSAKFGWKVAPSFTAQIVSVIE